MEIRLRPYKECDGEIIAKWIKDEEALRKWSADRFGGFPITGNDINEKYLKHNGDCSEPDNFYPMTAFAGDEVVGHLIMRFTDSAKKVLRFGFIIVDDSKRGLGCGKQMLNLAIRYAFEILKAQKITIGVFENNEPAYRCYQSVGFKESGEASFCEFFGENWKIVELELEK